MRDEHTQKTSHFFVYSRRATHDPHYIWYGDDVRTIFSPPNFLSDHYFRR